MSLIRSLPLFCLIVTLPSLALAEDPAAQLATVKQFDGKVKPLLANRCLDCHGADDPDGGVDLSVVQTWTDSARHRKLWKRAARRVELGEMPPEGATPLSAAEKKQLLTWMRAAADYVDFDLSRRDPGPAPLRRLSRTEYINTVCDLLYVPERATRGLGLPRDLAGDGFENQAAILSASSVVIERYFQAADKLAETLFGGEWYAGGARKKLFAAADPKQPEREQARAIVTQLVRRGYRRPANPADVQRVLAIYDRARRDGQPHEAGLRAIIKPVLVSPQFLFRMEVDRAAPANRMGARLDDNELAVRLSYFLWSTMPDDELFEVAAAGRLSDPATLDAQVQRMLKHPKAAALTANFAVQWVHLNKLHQARPKREFFPEFNSKLRDAMYQEVTSFFNHLRQEDRSILELLDADYTFVNDLLAKHYRIDGVKGNKMQKVALRPEHHRGGLLGMAGILTLTSHTFRTSPTQRGAYVLDVILGDPPPPPPPDAGQLKDDNAKQAKSPQTFKEKLAQHATIASCAGCHRKVDPLGFALDNYNAVGAWRESTKQKPLDVAGELPGGIQVNGADGLRQVILERRNDFARTFTEHLLSYALGRGIDACDESTVRETMAALEQNDYRFSTLVSSLVKSVPFRERRGLTTAQR